MTDVTQILSDIERGDQQAAAQLLPLVYGELRKLAAARMAHEKAEHTLQPTALVHDAYIRLVDVDKVQHWNSRGHFFAAAAEAMRRILVESARRRLAEKHGGKVERSDLPLENLPEGYKPEEIVSVDEVLDQLRAHDPNLAEIVELRFFAGFTLEELAAQRGISNRTIYRHWAYAKAWLREEIEQETSFS